ncbi:MAG: hypothetical protein JRI57_03075 [Deltaproteobacteria bacterium]|nr:hypothetical protein [Deltaproteobacteria bacterium]MBW1952105.1 hypothetical protein [Deltaproteobacteria bacterium]MBW1987628.1 hypothetical protein [Deltaproteobacteria bacterium]MBW2135601.1 hypothetical protein [Deltaproteobacteria bacterium]
MENPLTSESNAGGISESFAAIENIRRALNFLSQPIALVSGTVNLLLVELDQETNYNNALQAVQRQLKVILQVIDEIQKTVSRLLNHNEGANMKIRMQPQKGFKARRSPAQARGGSPTGNKLADDMDVVAAGKNIRQRLHELAQPLVVVTGTIDLLLLELEQESCHYQKLQSISEQLESIVNIIDEVRKVAREMDEAL